MYRHPEEEKNDSFESSNEAGSTSEDEEDEILLEQTGSLCLECGSDKEEFKCLLCSESHCLSTSIFQHMLEQHKLVIADVTKIAKLSSYLQYWKARLEQNPISEFATTIRSQLPTNLYNVCIRPKQEENDKDRSNASKKFGLEHMESYYYLLSDILPEDKELRYRLHRERLEEALMQQEKERKDNKFHRKCLFCSEVFSHNRKFLISHLYSVHNLKLGHPDNIVYFEKFFAVLEQKIQQCIFLYCEKKFTNSTVLKLHMRKKRHFKLNTKNKSYDHFYIINYLEEGKSWEDFQKEIDSDEENNENDLVTSLDDRWDDWKEDSENRSKGKIFCLFCDHKSSEINLLLDHQKQRHHFDFIEYRKQLDLDFYGCVKLVNFIREQMLNHRCSFCNQLFLDTTTTFDVSSSDTIERKSSFLLEHMEKEGHFQVSKDASFWNDSRFLVPSMKADAFLYSLEMEMEVENEEPTQRKLLEPDLEEEILNRLSTGSLVEWMERRLHECNDESS